MDDRLSVIVSRIWRKACFHEILECSCIVASNRFNELRTIGGFLKLCRFVVIGRLEGFVGVEIVATTFQDGIKVHLRTDMVLGGRLFGMRDGFA